ncbi:hypothetical protein [Aureimonas ureilytica]|uniref:hypothetical protein n=1 Tax=Aureimonas ureilytica TaxID=401562 RepID=UPI00037FA295|nr:hypothetical protein [Aureimonas ureilytica]
MSITLVNYLVSTNEDWRDAIALVQGEAEDPVDITDDEFVAQLRLPVEALHVLLEASTTNGFLQIVPPGTTGLLAWNVPASIMRTLPPGIYPYDMVWTREGNAIDRFAAGIVTIERGVTR